MQPSVFYYRGPPSGWEVGGSLLGSAEFSQKPSALIHVGLRSQTALTCLLSMVSGIGAQTDILPLYPRSRTAKAL